MDLSRDEDLPQRSSSFLVGNVFDNIIQLMLASKRAHYLSPPEADFCDVVLYQDDLQ